MCLRRARRRCGTGDPCACVSPRLNGPRECCLAVWALLCTQLDRYFTGGHLHSDLDAMVDEASSPLPPDPAGLDAEPGTHHRRAGRAGDAAPHAGGAHPHPLHHHHAHSSSVDPTFHTGQAGGVAVGGHATDPHAPTTAGGAAAGAPEAGGPGAPAAHHAAAPHVLSLGTSGASVAAMVAHAFAAIPLFRSLTKTEQAVVASSLQLDKYSHGEVVLTGAADSGPALVIGACAFACPADALID